MEPLKLYAGNIPNLPYYKGWLGLSLTRNDERHIVHDITCRHPFADNSVYAYQAEDVIEHIEYDLLPGVINDIHRILIPGGYFRLSLPDYRCDVLRNRSLFDENGNIIFDPGGGGRFENGKVTGGGHVWFPVYETVCELLAQIMFRKYKFFHYYDETGAAHILPVSYGRGYIQRTPDHDKRVKSPYRPMSIIVDCYK